MILAAIIIMVAVLSFFFYRFGRNPGATVIVLRDNFKEGEYSLEQDGEYRIYSENYGYNTLKISDGKASIIDADCPDGLCVYQGEISGDGEVIVCLPHKLVITIEGGEEAGIDAVTN